MDSARTLSPRAVPRLVLALPRPLRRALVVAALAAACLTALYYGWLRDSSLVAVKQVSVAGLTGPEAPRIRRVLERAGLEMTTLHVREDELRRAVATEPSIRSLRAIPDFPHGLRIDVLENRPVAAIAIAGSGRVPVAGNGTLMPDQEGGGVPEVRIGSMPRVARGADAPARIADAESKRLVRIAAAAPSVLLRRASTIERRAGEGIVVVLRDGPRVIFGDDTRLAAKWRATAGVLASKDAAGAVYVDVRLPNRPVAGGLTVPTPPAPAQPQAALAGPSTPASASPQPQPIADCQPAPDCGVGTANPATATAATPAVPSPQP